MNKELSHAHEMPPRYRPDIDGLRAIAVLAVIGFHAFPSLVKGGFVGVDVFFVISGFLISTIILNGLARKNFNFIEFYSRRIRRIFPALILVLVTCYAFGWFALLAYEYSRLGKHITAGAGFVSNFVFWNESGYFDVAAELKPLLHLWSLGIEEQFYLIWPLLLWFCHKKQLNLLTIIYAVAALSFAFNVYEVRIDNTAAFYSPQTRFWELMFGSILAYKGLNPTGSLNRLKLKLDGWLGAIIYQQPPKATGNILRNAQSALGIILVAAGIVFIRQKFFPGWWDLLPTIGTVCIISAGEKAWANRVLLSNRLLVWLGLISYPLYLWHWPLLTFARLLTGETPAISIRIAAIILSIVFAWLTYGLLEKPIRFGKNSRIKTIALILLMAIIGCLGFYSYKQSGQPFGKKIDEITKMYAVYPHDPSHDNECDTRFPQFAAFHRCRLSKPSSSPELVIIGDSHSGQYFNNMAKHLPDTVVMNIGEQACLPFATYASEECRKDIELTYSFIENQKSIKTVYLAGFWYHLMTGGFSQELSGGGILGHINYNDIGKFQSLGERLISDLIKAHKEVVFMYDNPDLDFSPLSCLNYRSIKILEKVTTPCAMKKTDFEKRSAEYDRILSGITEKFPNITFFDPKDYMCDDKYCWAMKDGKLLYHDRHHLSDYGAELLVKKLVGQ